MDSTTLLIGLWHGAAKPATLRHLELTDNLHNLSESVAKLHQAYIGSSYSPYMDLWIFGSGVEAPRFALLQLRLGVLLGLPHMDLVFLSGAWQRSCLCSPISSLRTRALLTSFSLPPVNPTKCCALSRPKRCAPSSSWPTAKNRGRRAFISAN